MSKNFAVTGYAVVPDTGPFFVTLEVQPLGVDNVLIVAVLVLTPIAARVTTRSVDWTLSMTGKTTDVAVLVGTSKLPIRFQ
ncbi:MAG: hypothetical protein ACRDSP_13685 [Pseudonocardiaceae bacterium]